MRRRGCGGGQPALRDKRPWLWVQDGGVVDERGVHAYCCLNVVSRKYMFHCKN